MEEALVVAPLTEELLRLEGDLAAGKPVEHLRFDGLSFQHTSWTIPREGIVDGQAAAFLGTATVFAQGARECRFTHCEIAHSGGYGLWLENGCQQNQIEYNHIHHLGWRQLSDMGGIYCLGDSPGTRLRFNLIHDVMSYPTGYGGWGIYTDEGSTGILIENNVVYRTKDGGFHQHYGRDNVVRNNVLAFSGGRGQVVRTRDESHRSFTFERNIVYYREPPLLGGNWNNAAGFALENNVYWRTDGTPPVFPGTLTLKEWQTKGHDPHSIVADPKFVAPDRHDFRLQDDSPAIQLGFQPIDISTAGLSGPGAWTKLPKKVERPPFVMPWEEKD